MPIEGIWRQPLYGERMVSPVRDNAWLEWMERLMGEPGGEAIPCLPASRFHCLVDDLPEHLAPQPFLRTQLHAAGRRLVLNPRCRFTAAAKLPHDSSGIGYLPEQFALPAHLAWVHDSELEMRRPFWLSRELYHRLAEARPGEVPSGLSEKIRYALALAEILVPEGYEASCRGKWSAIRERCAAQFRRKGYAPLAGLIHPLHIAALRRYYRYLIRTGRVWLGDKQSDRRYVEHNDGVARFFHRQITAAFSEIAGEGLKPSYVYLASYQGGAQLHKHTDREQCDFSITLCVDYSPEPARATPWPIHLETPSGRTSVFQALGDALLYRGCQLPHYRDPLPGGHTSTSIFFHYVKVDFAGALD